MPRGGIADIGRDHERHWIRGTRLYGMLQPATTLEQMARFCCLVLGVLCSLTTSEMTSDEYNIIW
jgi:hypothetical protein